MQIAEFISVIGFERYCFIDQTYLLPLVYGRNRVGDIVGVDVVTTKFVEVGRAVGTPLIVVGRDVDICLVGE